MALENEGEAKPEGAETPPEQEPATAAAPEEGAAAGAETPPGEELANADEAPPGDELTDTGGEGAPKKKLGGLKMPKGLLPLLITSSLSIAVIGGTIVTLDATFDMESLKEMPVAVIDIPPLPPPPTAQSLAEVALRGGGSAWDLVARGREENRAGEYDELDIAEDDGLYVAVAPKTAATATKGEPSATLRVGGEIVLPMAPDVELVDPGDNGPLPIIAADGRESWSFYARPFTGRRDQPRVSILLGGLGMSQSATLTAIQQLPGEITLAFNPYARELQHWIDQARAAGHEIMIEMPMEPHNYPENDPGPHTLLTGLDPADNIARAEWLLSRFAGYVGVTSYMGAKFTGSRQDLKPVLEILRSRGLMFLDSRASSNSVAREIAADIGLVQASNNRFIDTRASRATIDARLAELERIARARGSAIGIAFPYPVTIERLAAWAKTLEAKRLTLAPISAMATVLHRVDKDGTRTARADTQ